MPRVMVLPEAGKLLKRYGIAVASGMLAKSGEEAVAAAAEIGYPVAMKAVSDVLHKTEANAVRTNITSPQDAKKAYDAIAANVKKFNPGARLKGILVQEQLAGVETIVGSAMDPQFGPMISFGLGGVFVEMIKDVAFRVIPITEHDAEEMVHEIRGYEALAGFRGAKPVNLGLLKKTLLAVSSMVKREKIKELDINPLFVSDRLCVAADVRIVW